MQKDQKGLLELNFLTLDETGSFVQQLEKLFQDLEQIEKNEKWLQILDYAMSGKIVLQWKDNPVLNIIFCNEKGECKGAFSDDFADNFLVKEIGIDKKNLKNIIKYNENNYEPELDLKETFPISKGNDKIDNAFIACISAQELIEELLITPDGLLRRNIFDDNVRDSQGFSAVNQEIFSTLKECPGQFVLFNNGITIVCKKVELKKAKYVLTNPQIVNGCQTCSVIYQAYRNGIKLDDVQVIAKIVGSSEEDVAQGIVRGTNRQNIVYEEAFETIKGFHKDLERYFEINQVSGYDKIYYERRSRQYADIIQIKPQQKISFRGLIQSMVALFLNHVEDSHKHEYTLLKKYRDSLFVDTQSYQPYYLAAFLYLNVDILFKERKLPQTCRSYKMHIMLLIKEMVGGPSPDLSSKEIDEYCNRLLEVLEDGKLEQCAVEACRKFEDIRTKWIGLKGEQYQYGVKDSAEFRSFLIKEIHGIAYESDTDKIYTGYVMNVDLDRHNTLFGLPRRGQSTYG
ncbi:MAG: AIPR family protein [Lachnospiraceae bacterium]